MRGRVARDRCRLTRDYARDLEALRKKGLLADKCLVVADNVLFPGAPELLDYLNVPYVPATDAVSGQVLLRPPQILMQKFLKRAENDLKSIKRRGGDDVEADVADASSRLERARAAASRPARDAAPLPEWLRHDVAEDALPGIGRTRPTDDVLPNPRPKQGHPNKSP